MGNHPVQKVGQPLLASSPGRRRLRRRSNPVEQSCSLQSPFPQPPFTYAHAAGFVSEGAGTTCPQGCSTEPLSIGYTVFVTELMHADVFFFITAIAVIVLSVGAAVVLYYVIGIVRDVRAITEKVRTASDGLERDFEDLRATLKKQGVRTRTVIELLLSFLMRKIPKARIKSVKKETEQPTEE